ncbi:MAG TPA: HU family DNA-binding protein [Gemmatimonadales bacterium]|nr:HU family DNA-binding protein [Gemmatimonadales bacterium]
MTKPELISALADRLALPKAQAADIVDALFGPDGIIAEQLTRGERVQIAGFGNFETRQRAPRRGRDPRTGQEIAIEGSVAPAFRPGTALKELVNKKR